MRSTGRMVGVFVVGAFALLASAVCVGEPLGTNPTPLASARIAKFRLAEPTLSGLPTAIALQPLSQRLPAATAPRGIQYLQSPAGLSGMFIFRGNPLAGNLLFFLLRNEWTFLPDQRFQQVDPKGNRLLLGNGKAQVFNGAGLQIGALEDPGLVPLYGALLKLTM
jgi:hypothetical protein